MAPLFRTCLCLLRKMEIAPYIYKLLRQRRELGHITPLPHGGGAQLKLDDKALNVLAKLVKQEPDMTLDELRLQLRKKTKINVSVSTIWYGLEKRDMSVKKDAVSEGS